MNHRTIGWPRLVGVTVVACLASGGARVHSTSTAPAPPPLVAGRELTAADFEAFLSGLVPAQIRRDNIAGAVVAVVKGGRLLFAGGYGFADQEKRIPVSPDRTLFRPGSISKLFTWTAVMQQVEEGTLDLDKDVNAYLDFAIPATHPQPITLRHLMTHTSGFEEAAKNLFVRDADRLRPLREYLVSRLPARLFPPGTTPAYSNYGTALAGYIVGRVSGLRFEDYVARRIFTPLGMLRSTFAQPLPDAFKPLMSAGYGKASEKVKSFEFVQAAPAGSLSSTATDMSRFMIAHLQDGELEGQRILRADTARLMHARQFGRHPELNGMALGFYEESRNGRRIIGHGGDTAWFHSDLHLIPEERVGFFVSYNSAGSSPWPPRNALFEEFLDRYFPYIPPAAKRPASAEEDIHAVAGSYVLSRRADSTLLKAVSLFSQVAVSPNEDGTIAASLIRDASGEARKWGAVGPMLFQEVGGQERIAFRRDGSGGMQLAFGMFPFFIGERVGWLESWRFHRVVLFGSVTVLASTLVFWPVGGMVRWHYGRRLALERSERRLRIAVRLLCALNLGVMAGWAWLVIAAEDPATFSEPLDPWLRALQIAGAVGVAGAVLAIAQAFDSWRRPARWLWSRVWDSILALAFLGLGLFLLQWHFVHWSVNY